MQAVRRSECRKVAGAGFSVTLAVAVLLLLAPGCALLDAPVLEAETLAVPPGQESGAAAEAEEGELEQPAASGAATAAPQALAGEAVAGAAQPVVLPAAPLVVVVPAAPLAGSAPAAPPVVAAPAAPPVVAAPAAPPVVAAPAAPPVVAAPAAPPAAPPAAAPAAPPVAAPPAPRQPLAGSLRVENATVDSLALQLDGKQVGVLVPGGSTRSPALQPGVHELLATSAQSGAYHRQLLEVSPGRESYWRIVQRYGALEVHNASPDLLVLTLDGGRLGEVAPGKVRSFAEVPEGKRRLIAATSGGRVLRDEQVLFPAGGKVRWSLAAPPPPPAVARPEPASLEVQNLARVEARILLDGRLLGSVAPFAVRRFAGLQPGRHEARAEDLHGRALDGTRLALRPGEREVWRVDAPARPAAAPAPAPPRPATLTLTNRASEALELAVAGRSLGLVRQGASWSGEVPAGRVAVTGRGSETGEDYRLELSLRPGERRAAEFVARTGRLTLVNRDRRTAEVFLDGRSLGMIGGGRELVVPGVPVGRHRLELASGGERQVQSVVVRSAGARVVLDKVPQGREQPARRGDRQEQRRS